MATEDSVSKVSPGRVYKEALPDNIMDITKRLVKIETLLMLHVPDWNSAVPAAHAASHITGGGDVIANAVPGGNAGLMSGADKAKLDLL